MRGYAALARIDASSVHVGRALPRTPDPVHCPAPAATLHPRLAARRVASRAAEVLETLREQWAITTFYLFDPESWR